MEYEQIVYKQRIRNRRGRLESFTDLTQKAQKDLIKVKKKLCEKFQKELEVYVYGSYYHGYWDDESDYDVVISEKCDYIALDNELFKECGFKVNVQGIEKKLNILIP